MKHGEAPAQDKPELGRMFRGFLHLLRPLTRLVILAIGAALGAYFASGILRVILIVVAVLLGALIAWGVLLAVSGTIMMWILKSWLDQRRAREAKPDK